MLDEVRSDSVVQAPPGGLRKSWFHSAEGDLYVWLNGQNDVRSFQLSFFAGGEERTECWVEWDGRQRRVGTVDSREVDSRPHDIRSPMVELSEAPRKRIIEQAAEFLDREGGNLPEGLRTFVRKKVAA
ncbi:MAG TPA: hypothetical protein P5079_06535 [Elusimicrobiota bacterium]|nr:hypothetical protein [Elusimicrobiota bacterium]